MTNKFIFLISFVLATTKTFFQVCHLIPALRSAGLGKGKAGKMATLARNEQCADNPAKIKLRDCRVFISEDLRVKETDRKVELAIACKCGKIGSKWALCQFLC